MRACDTQASTHRMMTRIRRRTQAVFIAVVEEALPEQVVVEEYQLRVTAEAEHEICALVEPYATHVSAFWLTPK